jgi:hypothetical protein
MSTLSSQTQIGAPTISLPFALVLLIIRKFASTSKPNEHNTKMGREYLQGAKQKQHFDMKIYGSQYEPESCSHWRLRVCHQVSCLHHLSCS